MRGFFAVAVSLVAPVAAQTTWIVDRGDPTALPTLAAAVAAATDGDLIEIRHANEWIGTEITLTRSLRIFGNVGAGPSRLDFFAGGLRIVIPPGKEIVVANCRLVGWWGASAVPAATISIADSGGRVVLQDVPWLLMPVTITNSTQVLWSRVDLTAQLPLQIVDSHVAFDRCTLTGRSAEYETGRPSVPALVVGNGTVHCADTPVRGGDAAVHFGSPHPSLPGTRAIDATGSVLTFSGPSNVTSGTLATGAPIASVQSAFLFPPGVAPAIQGTSLVGHLHVPSVAAATAGGTLTLTVRSAFGSWSGLLFGAPGDRQSLPGVVGESWIDPQVLCAPLWGVQHGGLAWSVAVPPSPALRGNCYRWQAVALVGGAVVLGVPGSTMLR